MKNTLPFIAPVEESGRKPIRREVFDRSVDLYDEGKYLEAFHCLLDYLDERIFAPLHIEDACWGETKEGQNFGGWGLYLKTEDLAKTGQLILQNGKWNGKQLVPAEWIAEMTKKQVPSAPASINVTELVAEKADPDWIQGYGYQMWMCRHQAFRADGARGQFILVLPEQNTVIAMTADTPRMQDELQLVWNYILPVLNTLK